MSDSNSDRHFSILDQMPLQQRQTASVGSNAIAVKLNINGEQYELQLEPCVTLLDTLRDYLGLTGSKKVVTTGNVVLVRF